MARRIGSGRIAAGRVPVLVVVWSVAVRGLSLADTLREAGIANPTRRDLVDELSARVADIHSYDCPCVVALPIEGGHASFLEWIGAETRT